MTDRFHRWLYKRAYPTLNVGCNVSLSGRNQFGAETALSSGVIFRDSVLGDYSYVNYYSIVHRTTIGKFCSIGPHVVIGLGNHPVRRFVSTSPRLFLKGLFSDREQYDQFPPVSIGNDVWIGANTTIVNGVRIGDGAVIGANSVVTKDVPPYAIYGGGPADLLRFRFEEKQRDFLLKFRWWDKDPEWLRSNNELFSDIDKLMETYGDSLV